MTLTEADVEAAALRDVLLPRLVSGELGREILGE